MRSKDAPPVRSEMASRSGHTFVCCYTPAISVASDFGLVWFGLLRIYVALAVFQPYRDLEAGDNQSLKIQVARRGMEPRTSCSASQELNHSATAAPCRV